MRKVFTILFTTETTQTQKQTQKNAFTFGVCFGIIYTDRNDTGGLQHEGKSIFRIFRG